MKNIDPHKIKLPELHQLILGSVAPRPIAFASTIDKEGNPNLSPFSFFNAFGINPTTLIFSPSRRGRDNTTKHTYKNVKEVPEVVINTVSYQIVQQSNLSSTEYPKGTNEFAKAGLTPVASEKIRPFRVEESPVQFECKVREVIETGDQGGAANLVICEILLIHLDESILDGYGKIDPNKIDLVGRLGGSYYCRTSGDALFSVAKPIQKLGIGIDQLPDHIKHSKYLTGNELGMLGNIEKLPSDYDIEAMRNSVEVKSMQDNFGDNPCDLEEQMVAYARDFIAKGDIYEALRVLMC